MTDSLCEAWFAIIITRLPDFIVPFEHALRSFSFFIGKSIALHTLVQVLSVATSFAVLPFIVVRQVFRIFLCIRRYLVVPNQFRGIDMFLPEAVMHGCYCFAEITGVAHCGFTLRVNVVASFSVSV